MLINESHLSNQHTEIVRMFLDSEFFSTELSALSYFTHKVTLLFLYCFEISTWTRLYSFFPKLYKDLKEKNLDTLQQFFAPHRHVEVEKPSTDIQLNLLDLVCRCSTLSDAAMQERVWIYYRWLVWRKWSNNATISFFNWRNCSTSYEQYSCWALSCCNLTKSPVANFRNKTFKAKAICNDMVLYQPTPFSNPVQAKIFMLWWNC